MAERITIVIETSNAAFDESPMTEVGRILRLIATDCEQDGCPDIHRPRDINGNIVGHITVKRLRGTNRT